MFQEKIRSEQFPQKSLIGNRTNQPASVKKAKIEIATKSFPIPI
jgi:hypothetical protein